MFENKRIAVVIPAYNEERLIGLAVEQVPDFVDCVIVVDDASEDGTSSVVKSRVKQRSGLVCLRHPSNLGVGAAIVSGYRMALEFGADVVAVMAGDAQMDPSDLPKLLAPVVDGRADYAKGDRLSWPGVSGTMPMPRFVGNHLFSFLTRLTSGYREVRDSQCGYTAASSHILERIDLGSVYARYGFPNDILAHLNIAGARLAQVPVRPIYGSERSGISLATAVFMIPYVLVRSAWRRIIAAPGRRTLLEPASPKS